jgi:hypothetical protein
VLRADALVGVTKPIVDDLRARFGVEAKLITNGFDPDETGDQAGQPIVDNERHSLIYTGRLAAAGRSVEPLLAALRALKDSDSSTARRLEVVFAGPLTHEEKVLLSAPDLDGLVRTVGQLDRERVRALQHSADSLLVVAEGLSARSVATGKLFEYLGASRPILVLGKDTEAARIVTEARAGISTSATDAVAIAKALRVLVDAPPPPPAPGAVERYAYPRLAAELADVIEGVRRH